MSWIKSGNKRHEGIFLLFFSFVIFLAGERLFAFLLFSAAFSRSTAGVTVLKPASAKAALYAGFWLRFASYIIDSSFIFVPGAFIEFFAPNFAFQKLGFAFLALTVILVKMIMLKQWGQTPGNMVMGLRVVGTDFTDLTWTSILLRTFFDLLVQLWAITKFMLIYEGVLTFSSLLIPSDGLKAFDHRITLLDGCWTFLGLLTLLMSRRKQTLNDYLGGTVVLAEQKPLAKTYQVVAGGFLVFCLGMGLFFSHLFAVYQTGAQSGDPESERRLAELYLKGRTVAQDNAMAFQWFQKAADQEDDQAQYSIGSMYEKGLGVPTDQAQAIQWYSQAAKNGNRAARLKLKALGLKTD